MNHQELEEAIMRHVHVIYPDGMTELEYLERQTMREIREIMRQQSELTMRLIRANPWW